MLTPRLEPTNDRACDYLDMVAEPSGAVPVLFPSIAGYPRAPHWAETDHYTPGLNPTANIAAYLRALAVAHPWVDKATEYCFAALESGPLPVDAHKLLSVARFLEHASDTERAGSFAEGVAAALHASAYFQMVPNPDTYGLTPLDFAPSPRNGTRSWFDDDTIEAHLDHLGDQQQADGGWPIRWQPPSEASRCEFRAIQTLQALRVLEAYGRLPT